MHELTRTPTGKGSKIAFWMITAVHDNRLLPLIKNPARILKAAGLKAGQTVLEVGCGPGFYTMTAAEIVGPEGRVWALDVNPWAIRRVQNKVSQAGIKNVNPLCANASCSGLADQSVDTAFLFGLPRVAGGMESLLRELGRVIKPGGVVSFQKSRRFEKPLIDEMRRLGFELEGRQGRLLRLRRE